MEKYLGTDNDINLTTYELFVAEEQNTKLRTKIAECKKEVARKKKLYRIVSGYTDQTINSKTFNAVTLPRATWAKIMDRVYGPTSSLIKPSHYIAKYSLIRKDKSLVNSIPCARTPFASTLELLNDRSNSRSHEIINEYTPHNTKKAYTGDLVYWQAWLSAVGFTFNEPITQETVKTFIIQHAEGLDKDVDEKLVSQGYKQKLGPHKLATIKRRLISLSLFLDAQKWPNPCGGKDLKLLLSRLTKKFGASKPAGKAITKDILNDMLTTCDTKLIDIRDKALLLFTWGSGGRRRSEVVRADVANLTCDKYGEYVYKLSQSKIDQTGIGYSVPIKGRAARALTDWLEASHIKVGRLFCSVDKGGKLGGPLSDNSIHRIVRKRLKLAGYNENEYGAHSLRSGFVTEAGRQNKVIGDVMAMTTHRNVSTLMRYYQAGSINNNSAANLAD